MKSSDLRSPLPRGLFMKTVFSTVQDEEALAEPDLAPTLPVRASYEKTRVNIAKVEEGQLHAVLL